MIAQTASGSSRTHDGTAPSVPTGGSSGETQISNVPSSSTVTVRSDAVPTMRSEYLPSSGPP